MPATTSPVGGSGRVPLVGSAGCCPVSVTAPCCARRALASTATSAAPAVLSTRKIWGLRECERCALRRRLKALLDDGTGQPAIPLAPLVDALCAAPNPATSEMWAYSKQVRPLLRALATGELALSHQAFNALAPSHTVDHLRDLLMTVGSLPVRDRQILRFEQWTSHLLAGIKNQD